MVVCTYADSYVKASAREADAAAKLAATHKIAKYSDLSGPVHLLSASSGDARSV